MSALPHVGGGVRIVAVEDDYPPGTRLAPPSFPDAPVFDVDPALPSIGVVVDPAELELPPPPRGCVYVAPALRPAMTPEEWAKLDDRHVVEVYHELCSGARVPAPLLPGCSDERPVLAALALYRQSWGFTHEDIHVLNEASEVCVGEGCYEVATALQRLRERIEALLPPEEGHNE